MIWLNKKTNFAYLTSGRLNKVDVIKDELDDEKIGGTRDENLEKLIDIDGVTESVVYALAIGK